MSDAIDATEAVEASRTTDVTLECTCGNEREIQLVEEKLDDRFRCECGNLYFLSVSTFES